MESPDQKYQKPQQAGSSSSSSGAYSNLSKFSQANWKSIAILVVCIFFSFIIVRNLDLLIEYFRNNLITGFFYFLVFVLVHYSLFFFGLFLTLLWIRGELTKSKFIAVFYFALLFVSTTSFSGVSFITPFVLMVIFFPLTLGIWRGKKWAYILSLSLNIVFTIVVAILFIITTIFIPCEGLGCIFIGITLWFTGIGAGITLLTMPFLWFKIRVADAHLDRKKLKEIILLEIIFLMIIGGLISAPLLKIYNGRKTIDSQYGYIRKEQKQNEKDKIDEAIRSGLVFVPSKLPSGWKKEREAAYSGWVEFNYIKKGIERQSLSIKQSIGFAERLWEDKDSRYSEEDLQSISINGVGGVYFTWHTAACSVVDEIRELRWADKNFERQLYCSCPCTFSKDELIKIAESMKPLQQP